MSKEAKIVAKKLRFEMRKRGLQSTDKGASRLDLILNEVARGSRPARLDGTILAISRTDRERVTVKSARKKSKPLTYLVSFDDGIRVSSKGVLHSAIVADPIAIIRFDKKSLGVVGKGLRREMLGIRRKDDKMPRIRPIRTELPSNPPKRAEERKNLTRGTNESSAEWS